MYSMTRIHIEMKSSRIIDSKELGKCDQNKTNFFSTNIFERMNLRSIKSHRIVKLFQLYICKERGFLKTIVSYRLQCTYTNSIYFN